MIDINKEYKTVAGHKVKITSIVIIPNEINVYGILMDENSTKGTFLRWNKNGNLHKNSDSEFDLVEINEFDDFKHKKYDNFKIDDLVMVRDYDDEDWYPRHFSHVNDDGRACVFIDGHSSWTADKDDPHRTTIWNDCRHPTEKELKG